MNNLQGRKLQPRYPGPLSFNDNEVDRHLFCGREQEIDALFHQIRANRFLILFGKSGLGKTSLLQAGIFPLLRENALLPIPVRLNQVGLDPIEAVFLAVHQICLERAIDYERGNCNGLWEFFKTTDFWNGEILQTPVLVFDQFEELFTLQPERTRLTLSSALGELNIRGLPERIKQQHQEEKTGRFNDNLPAVKVILSLREEFVGTLEELAADLPVILEQRFRLKPLDQNRATRAVVEPAKKDIKSVMTSPFSYTDLALKEMMNFLVNDHGEVEPFQLQLICQHVEWSVLSKQQAGESGVLVKKEMLGGSNAMNNLLQNFYRGALSRLPFGLQKARVRKLCELGLLSPAGYRVSMSLGQIQEQYKVKDSTLMTLTNAFLIRQESRPGLKGYYFEISHDSLAKAIMKCRRIYIPLWVKKVVVTVGLIAILSSIFFSWSYSNKLAEFGKITKTTDSTTYQHLELVLSFDKSGEVGLLGRGAYAKGYYNMYFTSSAGLRHFMDINKNDFSITQIEWLNWALKNHQIE